MIVNALSKLFSSSLWNVYLWFVFIDVFLNLFLEAILLYRCWAKTMLISKKPWTNVKLIYNNMYLRFSNWLKSHLFVFYNATRLAIIRRVAGGPVFRRRWFVINKVDILFKSSDTYQFFGCLSSLLSTATIWGDTRAS